MRTSSVASAFWKRLMLSIVAGTLSLSVLEGAARIYATITKQQRGVTFHPVLGWKPIPHVSKFGEFWGRKRPATNNSQGWRDRERSVQKPDGMMRAIAVGDSFTAGVSVDDGERFTDLLERSLNRLEVLNMGVAGFGTDQELLTLEAEGFAYKPDFVIVTTFLGNDLNDIRCNWRHSWPKPVFLLDDGNLSLQPPHITPGVYIRINSYLGEKALSALRPADDSRFSPALEHTDPLPLFQKILERMKKESANHHAKLIAVLAYAPDRVGQPATEEEDRVRSAFSALGIPFIDSRETFYSFPDHGASLYADDGTHWNARGHRVIADTLSTKLKELAWMDEASGNGNGRAVSHPDF